MKFHKLDCLPANVVSLPVRGAWVEISPDELEALRTPSLPVRGAWVEIQSQASYAASQESLPVRGAWVEIWSNRYAPQTLMQSLPVRGAWVEMPQAAKRAGAVIVAPRAGSVG